MRASSTLNFASLLLLAVTVPVSGQDYYADVRPILERNCLACHSAEGPGWSMEDPESTYALRHAIAAAILERRMPPWLAEPGHQEYVGSRALPQDVLDLVRRWQEAGFAKGAPGSATRLGSLHDATHSTFVPDLGIEVLPDTSYLPDQSLSDDYRCFLLEWPLERPAYITGFRAVVGNSRVGHHLVAYAISPEMRERFRELDDEEEGLGYQCFGGPIPDRLGTRDARAAYEARYPDGVRELDEAQFWLAHWAPGMDGHDFPAGTGIRLEPGSAVVVQMHYYAGAARGARDAGTRMDFRIADTIERPAFHLPQTQGSWLEADENGSMVVPAGRFATYAYSDNLGNLLPYIARVTGVPEERIQGLEIHSANLHMHAIGHSGEVFLLDRHGRKETLLAIPRWDLRWQQDFPFTEPKVFERRHLQRTTLGVECTFRNPKDRPVFGGYGSDDEMCFNFSYIAVRTGDVTAAGGTGSR